MKKDNSILYFGVFFAASILAEIYCILEKINIIGVSIVIAIATYLLLDAIRNEKIRYNEKLERYFGERLDGIEKVQKALYVQTKKNSESIEEKLDQINQNRKVEAESIIDTQNKAAKIVVKYVREDIKKASAINKAGCEKIAATMHQSADKIIEERNKSNFDSNELIKSIDSNFSNLIDRMENRMRDIEKECIKLEQISDNLRLDVKSLYMNAQPMQASVSFETPVQQNRAEEVVIDEIESGNEDISKLGEAEKDANKKDSKSKESKPKVAKTKSAKSIEAEAIDAEPIEVEPIEAEAIDAEPIEVEPIEAEQNQADTNHELNLLSQDNIIDLGFAKEEAAPAMEEEPIISIIDETEKKEVFESNKQLSADEISALFAAAAEETEISNEMEEPIDDIVEEKKDNNPNRQLSADEIAAMFATLDDSNDNSVDNVIETEKIEDKDLSDSKSAEDDKKKEMPTFDMSDPNKQLSAEEIAALFASMG